MLFSEVLLLEDDGEGGHDDDDDLNSESMSSEEDFSDVEDFTDEGSCVGESVYISEVHERTARSTCIVAERQVVHLR